MRAVTELRVRMRTSWPSANSVSTSFLPTKPAPRGLGFGFEGLGLRV
jgi:hypothetical protein